MPVFFGMRGFDQLGVPAFIPTMHCKNALGEINSNDDNAYDLLLL